MKTIYTEDIKYSEIFKYKEFKYSFYFYKNYNDLFNFKYKQFHSYYYSGKPTVNFIFIGGFLRINEGNLDDITPMYVFLIYSLLLEKLGKENLFSIFFNDMLLLNKKFQEIPEKVKISKLILNNFMIDEKLNKIITYSIEHENELLKNENHLWIV